MTNKEAAQSELSDVAVSAMAVEEMLKDLLPKRGMWEIEGDEAKTAICEVIKDALEGLWKLPFVKTNSKESSFTHKALDTINRQVAITAIQKAYADTEGGTDKCAVWKNVGLTNALHIMQDLPSVQQEQRWITCSDGTPKKTGYYICTCHDGACYRTSTLKWSTGWVLTGARSYWKVIAWMPLPEPYGGEQE